MSARGWELAVVAVVAVEALVVFVARTCRLAEGSSC